MLLPKGGIAKLGSTFEHVLSYGPPTQGCTTRHIVNTLYRTHALQVFGIGGTTLFRGMACVNHVVGTECKPCVRYGPFSFTKDFVDCLRQVS